MRKEIKERMVVLKMTATQLSEHSGVRMAAISRYLSGKAELNSANLEKLAEALNLKLISDGGDKLQTIKNMIMEIPEKGFSGTREIDKQELMSYVLGMLAARIWCSSRNERKDNYMEIISQDWNTGALCFTESVKKMAEWNEFFSEIEKEIFTSLCMEISRSGINKADSRMFISGFFQPLDQNNSSSV